MLSLGNEKFKLSQSGFILPGRKFVVYTLAFMEKCVLVNSTK